MVVCEVVARVSLCLYTLVNLEPQLCTYIFIFINVCSPCAWINLLETPDRDVSGDFGLEVLIVVFSLFILFNGTNLFGSADCHRYCVAMSEPTKQEISQVFKRLRALGPNKVSFTCEFGSVEVRFQ